MKQRTQRPKAEEYRTELMSRFGIRPHACQMDMVGMTPSDERKPYVVAEGVAIIDICGVLTNDAWYWDETGYDDIRDEVEMALGDSSVSAILLNVNSPGGETNNAFETAAFLAEAAKKKPMYAVANNMAYSAAYLLASAADRIYAQPTTGGVGSIGVYSVHMDMSGMLKQAGIKPTIISAGKGKTDGNPYEPLSPEAKAKIAAEVDRLYGEFVGFVAKSRGMTSDRIVNDMGAAVFNGAAACIASGLADREGSDDTAWFDLAAKISNSPIQPGMAASADVPISLKEASMPENTQAADATVTPTPVAVAPEPTVEERIAAARAEGYASAQNDMLEVVELSAIAGKPTAAADMIRRKLTPAKAREELLTAKAAAEPAINSHILSEEGLTAAAGESPLVRDAKMRSAMAKKEGK